MTPVSPPPSVGTGDGANERLERLGRDLDALREVGDEVPDWEAQGSALLSEARALHAQRAECEILRHLGFRYHRLGRYEEALEVSEQARDLALAIDDPVLIARARCNVALTHSDLGHYGPALGELEQASEAACRAGDLATQFFVLSNLAHDQRRAGQLGVALERQRQAADLAHASGEIRQRLVALTGLIEIYADLGQHDDVLATAAELEAGCAAAGGEAQYLALARACVSRSLLGLGEPRRALEQACLGLRSVQELPVAAQAAHILPLALAQARALAALGELGEAREVLGAAVAGRDSEDTGLLEAAQELLADLAQRLGDMTAALGHLRARLALGERRHRQQLRASAYSLSAEQQVRRLERERAAERQRNVELRRANRALRLTQTALWYRATHDMLTGLMGRHAFTREVERALGALPPGRCLALVYLDLDGFRGVNDLHGQEVGDELLQAVAERLSGAATQLAGSGALAGHMGADEFTLLLPGLRSVSEARSTVQALHTALNRPFQLRRHLVELGVPLGYALAPRDGTAGDELRRRADLALSHVKQTSRAGSLEFTGDLEREYQEQLRLEQELRGALGRDELELHYQGRYTTQGGQLVGFEALLRWQHPERGLVPPGAFIALAEDSGLILKLGSWALRQACAQAAAWQLADRGLSVSVNVAVPQFEQPEFVEEVRGALRDSGIPGRTLILELTESVFLRNVGRARSHLKRLRDLGVQVALDDFGTGYSSLSLLRELPLGHLKIDRSFLRSVEDKDQGGQRGQALLDVIVCMARTLDLQVTAEGVEDEAQLALLAAVGCDFVQGYLLSSPLTGPEAEQCLPPLPPAG